MNLILFQGASISIFDKAPTILIDIIIALVIVLLGFMAGKIIGSILNKILFEMQIDKGLSKFKKQKISVVKGISSSVSLVIYIVAVIIALNHLKILFIVLMAAFAILAIIILGSFLISFVSSFPKAYYGFNLLLSKKTIPGTHLDSSLVHGNVQKSGILNTKVISVDDEIIYLPNNLLFRIIRKN